MMMRTMMVMTMIMRTMMRTGSHSKTASKVVSSGSARRWQETRRRYSLKEREACLKWWWWWCWSVFIQWFGCSIGLNPDFLPTLYLLRLAQSLPSFVLHLPEGRVINKLSFEIRSPKYISSQFCALYLHIYIFGLSSNVKCIVRNTLKPRHLRSFCVSRRFNIPSLS